MSQTMCENCRNYVYDDESDCMICEMDLDEDEMRLFLTVQVRPTRVEPRTVRVAAFSRRLC